MGRRVPAALYRLYPRICYRRRSASRVGGAHGRVRGLGSVREPVLVMLLHRPVAATDLPRVQAQRVSPDLSLAGAARPYTALSHEWQRRERELRAQSEPL